MNQEGRRPTITGGLGGGAPQLENAFKLVCLALNQVGISSHLDHHGYSAVISSDGGILGRRTHRGGLDP